MRRFVAPLAAIVITYCVLVGIDLAGVGWIAREERQQREAIERERESLHRYRRRLVVGEPLDQNAAAWYQRAFENMGPHAAEAHQKLLPLLTSAVRPPVAVIDAAYRNHCAEAESPRVQAALSSTRCTWDSSNDFQLESSKDAFQAMVLGHCLALNGARQLAQRDWAGAARAFLTTLAVASDFSQGTLQMNAAGIGAAEQAVRGFAEAISEIRDPDVIDPLAAQFARLEAGMPSYWTGLRQHQLSSALQAPVSARAYVRARRQGLAVLVPWHAIGAWWLWREERRIASMSQLRSTLDSTERARLAADLSQATVLSPGVLPETFRHALSQHDRLLRAVQAAHTVIARQRREVRRP